MGGLACSQPTPWTTDGASQVALGLNSVLFAFCHHDTAFILSSPLSFSFRVQSPHCVRGGRLDRNACVLSLCLIGSRPCTRVQPQAFAGSWHHDFERDSA